jgi:hypothetical protein
MRLLNEETRRFSTARLPTAPAVEKGRGSAPWWRRFLTALLQGMAVWGA